MVEETKPGDSEEKTVEKVEKKERKYQKNKVKRMVSEGRLYVVAGFNNTIVTITDLSGKTLEWTTSGKLGFKGTRKSTPFAATAAVEDGLRKATALGIKRLEVYIKGPGPGRDAALRALRAFKGTEVVMISDITPMPHNGPRPPKRRRV